MMLALYQRLKKLTLFWPFCVSRQKRFAFRLRRGLRLYPEALSRYSRGRCGGRSRGPYTSDQKSHFQSPLVLENLSLKIAGKPLLSIERLTVAAGEIVSLIGPSGSGKSTLLRALAGLGDPAVEVRGHMWVGDQRLNTVPAYQRAVGYLDQRPTLFPHMNVRQNLAFGQRRRDPQALDQALATAGLAGRGDQDVATLSGGQAARVALMRTLLSAPRALLLDEPFAALDPQLCATMRGFVFDQVRARGLPVLLVTHDRDDALDAGGAVLAIKNGTLVEQSQS